MMIELEYISLQSCPLDNLKGPSQHVPALAHSIFQTPYFGALISQKYVKCDLKLIDKIF